MRRLFVFSISVFMLGVLVLLFVLVKPGFAAEKCPVNMVPVGPMCVDKYEASVWSQLPDRKGNPQGTQYGTDSPNVDGFVDVDYPCSDNGNDCSDPSQPTKMIFAISAPGVMPSSFITWFQAQQACANVEKRLLRNGEWQMAAAGTPDDSSCHLGLLGVVEDTDAREATCVSNWGVVNMVGNLAEWVEDWIQPNTGADGVVASNSLYGFDGIFGIDDAASQGGGAGFPAALVRDGSFVNNVQSGVFFLSALSAPSNSSLALGFRCAR